MLKSRFALALFTSLAVSGAIVAALVVSGGGADALGSRIDSLVGGSAASAIASDGSSAKFAFLAQQNSNSCGLEPRALARMSSRLRLQGSCCFPMNLGAYTSQVRGLRAYAGVSEIPRDPYDVPVSLAKRLLAYDHAIHLSPIEAQTYSTAMRISRLKGPCCCPCWRWYAFRGLSKHLIADRAWRAGTIAAVIDLLEACGGPASSA